MFRNKYSPENRPSNSLSHNDNVSIQRKICLAVRTGKSQHVCETEIPPPFIAISLNKAHCLGSAIHTSFEEAP